MPTATIHFAIDPMASLGTVLGLLLAFRALREAARTRDQQSNAGLDIRAGYRDGLLSLESEKASFVVHGLHLIPESVEAVSKDELDSLVRIPLGQPLLVEEGSARCVKLPANLNTEFSKGESPQKIALTFAIPPSRYPKHLRTVHVNTSKVGF